MKSILNIPYKENLCLDLHLPEARSFPLFVYFHGGGLCSGSKDVGEEFAKMFTDRGIALAAVDYRMYPDAKFPDFIEDSAQSIRFLKDNIGTWGACTGIFAGGSSAGGYISMMLCFDKRFLTAVAMSPLEITGWIHDAGQPTSHFNVLQELGKDSRRLIVDETAPLYFVGLEESYSPMRFILATQDMFGREEQTMLTMKTLEHFGHKDKISLSTFPGQHVCYVGTDAFAECIANFIFDCLEKV